MRPRALLLQWLLGLAPWAWYESGSAGADSRAWHKSIVQPAGFSLPQREAQPCPIPEPRRAVQRVMLRGRSPLAFGTSRGSTYRGTATALLWPAGQARRQRTAGIGRAFRTVVRAGEAAHRLWARQALRAVVGAFEAAHRLRARQGLWTIVVATVLLDAVGNVCRTAKQSAPAVFGASWGTHPDGDN